MMKPKKIPMRTCVITKEKLPKRELIRVVKNKEGMVMVDPTGKANGRGAYIKLDLETIQKARKSKTLNRHLEIDVPSEIYDQLEAMLQK